MYNKIISLGNYVFSLVTYRRKNMHIISGFIVREIAGETIAIPSGDATKTLSGLLALNESGKFLFELLRTEQTEANLVEALLNEYDIDSTTAQADVSDFLEILRSSGVLIENE
jgi:hypothetical protein